MKRLPWVHLFFVLLLSVSCRKGVKTLAPTQPSAKTPTFTATHTPTPTPQPSSTPTETPTSTLSPTQTYTVTPSFTTTWTLTPTLTYTWTLTATGTFCADQATGHTCTPTDTPAGATWHEATSAGGFPPRYGLGTAVFDAGQGERMWVVGGGSTLGYADDVWSSADGVTWDQATASGGFGGRYNHACLAYQGKLWVIGGYPNVSPWLLDDVWSSPDGVHWTEVTVSGGFGGRQQHSALVFDDGGGEKIWVIGGSILGPDMSDVWCSSDGVRWTQKTAAAGFAPRHYHTSVVFGGRMWVIGGSTESQGVLNDVWSSADGIHWTQETPYAGFKERWGALSLVYGGRMWEIGGWGPTFLNDTWSSADGVHWDCSTPNADFSPRYFLGGAVFNNRMWVIAGSQPYVEMLKSDVWYSP